MDEQRQVSSTAPAASPAPASVERQPPGKDALETLVRSALGERRLAELRAKLEALRASGRLSTRLLFTVTPGRSGTGALAHILGGFRDVTATHEPKPSFANALRAANLAPGIALEFWVRRKLPAIAPARTSCYVETSHLACLGFLKELELLGVPFELILLTRPARAVALSLWRLDTIPGRTLRGHRYYLSPRDSTLLRLGTDQLDRLHDYQLCYWYACEVEARQEYWAARSERGGPAVHRLTTDELEGRQAAALVGHRLGLGARRFGAELLHDRRALGHRNQKDAKKLSRSLPEDELARMERDVRAHWAQPSAQTTKEPADGLETPAVAHPPQACPS